MSPFYSPDGEPITGGEWAAMLSSEEHWRIALDEGVGDAGVTVSTVWLGRRFETPIFGPRFETMIFGGPHDEMSWQYPTREQAVAGHASVCQWIRDGYSDRPVDGLKDPVGPTHRRT